MSTSEEAAWPGARRVFWKNESRSSASFLSIGSRDDSDASPAMSLLAASDLSSASSPARILRLVFVFCVDCEKLPLLAEDDAPAE